MPKIRGYVDSVLMQKAIKQWPELAKISSTTGQLEYIVKTALELVAHNNTKKVNQHD